MSPNMKQAALAAAKDLLREQRGERAEIDARIARTEAFIASLGTRGGGRTEEATDPARGTPAEAREVNGRIRRIAKDRGVSQKTLAAALGIAQSKVSHQLRSGRWWSEGELEAIAQTLHMPLGDLVGVATMADKAQNIENGEGVGPNE